MPSPGWWGHVHFDRNLERHPRAAGAAALGSVGPQQVPLVSQLGWFAEMLQRDSRMMFRRMLADAATGLFGSPEERAQAQAWVDALSDEEIDKRMGRWVEATSKVCPECHRPYDDDE